MPARNGGTTPEELPKLAISPNGRRQSERLLEGVLADQS